MIGNRARTLTIGPAREQKQYEKARDQAFVKRRELRFCSSAFIDQRRTRPKGEEYPQTHHGQSSPSGISQAFSLTVSKGLITLVPSAGCRSKGGVKWP